MAKTELVGLLREIRYQQREALQLQRDHLLFYQAQLTRIGRINDRAEAIQGRSALRLIPIVVLPLVAVLLGLMFRPNLRDLLA